MSLYTKQGYTVETVEASEAQAINRTLALMGARFFSTDSKKDKRRTTAWKETAYNPNNDAQAAINVAEKVYREGKANLACVFAPGSRLGWLDFDVKDSRTGNLKEPLTAENLPAYWDALHDVFPGLDRALTAITPSLGRHYLVSLDGLDALLADDTDEHGERGKIRYYFNLKGLDYEVELIHGGACYVVTAPGELIKVSGDGKGDALAGRYEYLAGYGTTSEGLLYAMPLKPSRFFDVASTEQPKGKIILGGIKPDDEVNKSIKEITRLLETRPKAPSVMFDSADEYLEDQLKTFARELRQCETEGLNNRNNLLNAVTYRLASTASYYFPDRLDEVIALIAKIARDETDPSTFTNQEIAATIRSGKKSAASNKTVYELTHGYAAIATDVVLETVDAKPVRLEKYGHAFLPGEVDHELREGLIAYTTGEKVITLDGIKRDYSNDSILAVAAKGFMAYPKDSGKIERGYEVGNVKGSLSGNTSIVRNYINELFLGAHSYVPVRRPIAGLHERGTLPNDYFLPWNYQVIRLSEEGLSEPKEVIAQDGLSYRHLGDSNTILKGTLDAYATIPANHKIGWLDVGVTIAEEYRLAAYPLYITGLILHDHLEAPLITLVGPMGAGKTHYITELGYILNGKETEVVGMNALNPENLFNYADSVLLPLDEAGAYFGQYETTIKQLTRGIGANKRKLWTDSEIIKLFVHPLLITTSVNDITGSNEQIASRAFRLELEERKRPNKYPPMMPRELLQAELLWLIVKILPLLPSVLPNNRMEFVDRIAQALGMVNVGFDYEHWRAINERDYYNRLEDTAQNAIISTFVRFFDAVFYNETSRSSSQVEALIDVGTVSKEERTWAGLPKDIRRGIEILRANYHLTLQGYALTVFNDPALIGTNLKLAATALKVAGYEVMETGKHTKNGNVITVKKL